MTNIKEQLRCRLLNQLTFSQYFFRLVWLKHMLIGGE